MAGLTYGKRYIICLKGRDVLANINWATSTRRTFVSVQICTGRQVPESHSSDRGREKSFASKSIRQIAKIPHSHGGVRRPPNH